MFDPAAALARIGLLLSLVQLALERWLQPRGLARATERMERDLAEGLRATVDHAGIAAPPLGDAALSAWVGCAQPFRLQDASPDFRAVQGRTELSRRTPIHREDAALPNPGACAIQIDTPRQQPQTARAPPPILTTIRPPSTALGTPKRGHQG